MRQDASKQKQDSSLASLGGAGRHATLQPGPSGSGSTSLLANTSKDQSHGGLSTLKPSGMGSSARAARRTPLTAALTSLVRGNTLRMRGVGDEETDGRGFPEAAQTFGGGASNLTKASVSKGAEITQEPMWLGERGGRPVPRKLLLNFGTMQDFFDYSGVMVQAARMHADLADPPSLGYKLLPQAELK